MFHGAPVPSPCAIPTFGGTYRADFGFSWRDCQQLSVMTYKVNQVTQPCTKGMTKVLGTPHFIYHKVSCRIRCCSLTDVTIDSPLMCQGDSDSFAVETLATIVFLVEPSETSRRHPRCTDIMEKNWAMHWTTARNHRRGLLDSGNQGQRGGRISCRNRYGSRGRGSCFRFHRRFQSRTCGGGHESWVGQRCRGGFFRLVGKHWYSSRNCRAGNGCGRGIIWPDHGPQYGDREQEQPMKKYS